ncbi:hypothetical protein EBT31_20270, partial [bacterium]|nr:hypothetical protein [bacterium]
KTGTTNDSNDVWFAGYNPRVAAVAWIGFDKPKSLGDRETGGGLALPIWINFMSVALRGVPELPRTPPPGVVEIDGDWAIPDYAHPEKGEKVRSELRSFAKSIGYSDTELANATDSRAVLTLWMASQYQKLQKAKPGVTKKVTEAPKMLRAGNATGKTIATEAAKQDFARLKKTGSRQDAARVFERFL